MVYQQNYLRNKYSAADAKFDNQNFKFHVTNEYKPLLLMSCKTTILNEKDAVPSPIKSKAFDYSDFQKYIII